MMLVNGAPADSIPAVDRGLAYGDGVFRTLRTQNGEPMHWARHYAKLSGDCTALGISCPPEALLLTETRAVAVRQLQAVVKIMVTRGSGQRGYAPPPNPCVPMRVVMSLPRPQFPATPAGITVHLCRLRLSLQSALAGIKHLNRLENVLSRMEWDDPAIAEGLLLDQDGFAIGGTMSNLFIVECGQLATPLLSRCGVAGVTRMRVIDIAAKSGITCRVEHLTLQRVLDADEVFLVNSVIGLWPVARMLHHNWRAGTTAIEFRQALEVEDAALA